MSNTINNTRNVECVSVQPTKKSHTARNTLGFVGMSAASLSSALAFNDPCDSLDINFERTSRKAVESYEKNADKMKRVFTKSQYVDKYIKDTKVKAIATAAGAVVAATAAGAALGTLIDAAVNKTKSNK